jgi:hypothetical protein
MKLWKNLIRIWLTLASLLSFLVGWVVLAHAPKPNQFKASNVPAMPRLDPVPSLEQVMHAGQSQQPQIVVRPSQQRMPVLRSGGS